MFASSSTLDTSVRPGPGCEGSEFDLGRPSLVLFDHRRNRLNLDGAVLAVDRDEEDDDEEVSAIDGTQLGRGNTDS